MASDSSNTSEANIDNQNITDSDDGKLPYAGLPTTTSLTDQQHAYELADALHKTFLFTNKQANDHSYHQNPFTTTYSSTTNHTSTSTSATLTNSMSTPHNIMSTRTTTNRTADVAYKPPQHQSLRRPGMHNAPARKYMDYHNFNTLNSTSQGKQLNSLETRLKLLACII